MKKILTWGGVTLYLKDSVFRPVHVTKLMGNLQSSIFAENLNWNFLSRGLTGNKEGGE